MDDPFAACKLPMNYQPFPMILDAWYGIVHLGLVASITSPK